MNACERLPRVVVSDIFGRTPELDRWAARLPGVAAVVDPYGGHRRRFASDADAYAAFVSEMGVEGYSAQLARCLRALDGPVSVLGFSAGGAAAWCLPPDVPVTGVLCFYPSQVRHHADSAPAWPVHVVLPQHESHFSVDELATRVAQHPTVTLTRSVGAHGFMNPLSSGFDARLSEAVSAMVYAQAANACVSHCDVGAALNPSAT